MDDNYEDVTAEMEKISDEMYGELYRTIDQANKELSMCLDLCRSSYLGEHLKELKQLLGRIEGCVEEIQDWHT